MATSSNGKAHHSQRLQHDAAADKVLQPYELLLSHCKAIGIRSDDIADSRPQTAQPLLYL